MIITHSGCVFVASVIQHAKSTCRITLSHEACPVVQKFSTLSQKQEDFLKKNIEHEMCLLILSAVFSF
jgi:hypothetical protein